MTMESIATAEAVEVVADLDLFVQQALEEGAGEAVQGAQLVVLAHVLKVLRSVLRELQEQVERAQVRTYSTSTASIQMTPFDFLEPVFRVTIINDGPSNLEWQVPYGQGDTVGTLRSGDSIEIGVKKALITGVGIRMVAGGTRCDVRFVGVV